MNYHLYPGEDGYIIAECTDLPGVVSQGKDYEEALANIKEAAALFLEEAIEGQTYPLSELWGDE